MINPANSQDVYKDIGHAVKFIVLNLKRVDQEKELQTIETFADKLPSLINSMRIRQENSELKVAFGFSKAGFEYLFPKAKLPKELEDFKTMAGKNQHQMPATGGDLFLHIRAADNATVYELTDQIMQFIKDITEVIDETDGFRYFEGRAIIGFIDGTEAPAEQDSAEYAIIGDEDPDFIDGSYAFAQKWIHDMQDWNGKSTEEQEKAVGRHKFSDVELEEDDKDHNAHNIASKIEEGGQELKIVRMNVPFSQPAVGETGTYFIGYSRHWLVTKKMLEQMLKLDDQLLSFSTIKTGQLFFIPSRSLLAEIASGDFK